MAISDPQHTDCSSLIKHHERNIHLITKTMSPPAYQHDDFVATHIEGINRPKCPQQANQGV